MRAPLFLAASATLPLRLAARCSSQHPPAESCADYNAEADAPSHQALLQRATAFQSAEDWLQWKRFGPDTSQRLGPDPAAMAQGGKEVDVQGSTSRGTPVFGSRSSENASGIANASAAPANATRCATKKDPRINAWFRYTAKEGSPCVFGADDRDEGAHCIPEDGKYGSNGWCWTKKDRSEWGSCNGHCPLFGEPKAIADKLDSVAQAVGDLVTKVAAPTVPATTPTAPATASTTPATTPAVPATTPAVQTPAEKGGHGEGEEHRH